MVRQPPLAVMSGPESISRRSLSFGGGTILNPPRDVSFTLTFAFFLIVLIMLHLLRRFPLFEQSFCRFWGKLHGRVSYAFIKHKFQSQSLQTSFLIPTDLVRAAIESQA